MVRGRLELYSRLGVPLRCLRMSIMWSSPLNLSGVSPSGYFCLRGQPTQGQDGDTLICRDVKDSITDRRYATGDLRFATVSLYRM